MTDRASVGPKIVDALVLSHDCERISREILSALAGEQDMHPDGRGALYEAWHGVTHASKVLAAFAAQHERILRRAAGIDSEGNLKPPGPLAAAGPGKAH